MVERNTEAEQRIVEERQVLCPITGETDLEGLSEVAGIYFNRDLSLSHIRDWQEAVDDNLVKEIRAVHQEQFGETEPGRVPDEYVERTDTGMSIEHQMTRGTGTRDQDKLTVKAKGATREEALEDLWEAKEELEEYMSQVREIQPDQEDEDA